MFGVVFGAMISDDLAAAATISDAGGTADAWRTRRLPAETLAKEIGRAHASRMMRVQAAAFIAKNGEPALKAVAQGVRERRSSPAVAGGEVSRGFPGGDRQCLATDTQSSRPSSALTGGSPAAGASELCAERSRRRLFVRGGGDRRA
jgi:hypothetical protein